jgi:hypothetical protein
MFHKEIISQMKEEERVESIKELEGHLEELEERFISGLADLSKMRMLLHKVLALALKKNPNKGKK